MQELLPGTEVEARGLCWEFASLCELLDPSLIDGRGSLRGERYREHVVRRLKCHVKDPVTGQELFKERMVQPIAVTPEASYHPHFMELQRALLDLLAPELRRSFRARRYSDVLSFIALLKRSVSTVAACQSTLEVVAERFQTLLTVGAEGQEGRRQRLRTLREYQRKLERFGTVTPEEEEERHLLEAEDLAQRLADLQRQVRTGSRSLKRTADVVAALDDLISLAEHARHADPKLHQLVTEIATIRHAEPGANVLVYTEYTTSQQAAAARLREAGLGDVLTMSGDDADDTRQQITKRFRSQDGLVLVSTDTAAEGLNLQDRCHHLIHLELPFNPNRLEQRNGRIDRYGQTQHPMVRYLYLRGTFEERILLRLIAKYERQRARLTFVPNTLGVTTSSDAASERLLKGLLEEDTRLFQTEETRFDFTQTDEEAGADEATRELLEEIDRSLKGFERATHTHTWLGDAGLHAEERLLTEATAARGRGDRAEAVDLARFTTEAILLDGGDCVGQVHDAVFEVVLPPSWLHGLDDLPGYDWHSRRVRLTTHLEVMQDARGRPVGFLGRAHPLVRRALDRVRNLSFGASARHGQDPRVSVVAADVPEPTLLYTFLGRVASQAGREFERVLAVEITAAGKPQVYHEASRWISHADPARARRTTDVWKQHFAPWASQVQAQMPAAAATAFQSLAESFIAQRRQALQLRVLDPATGSGHFLVEACRFLGEKLYEACRLCDERALEAERRAEQARTDAAREAALAEAAEYQQRILDLPDPDDELVRYLPSRAPEGEESGLSQQTAEALCRRLVAVHCLYGVDKNPLAVELAKLSLWLESHAEGFPLTFLDHRLVLGDSLTGPFFEHLLTYPGSQEPLDDLFAQGLRESFIDALTSALKSVHDLEASIGASLAEVEAKTTAKARLDHALAPFKVVAAAWASGVMLGGEDCDDPAYARLVGTVSETGDIPDDLSDEPRLRGMLARGLGVKEVPTERLSLLDLVAAAACVPALPYELVFPEVFFPHGELGSRAGFDAVLGNPPWDAVRPKAKEFFAAFDFAILAAPTKRERAAIEKRLKEDTRIVTLHEAYLTEFTEQHRIHDALYQWQVVRVNEAKTGGDPDLAKIFLERNAQLLRQSGRTGVVVPSAFHANEGATGIRRLYLEKMALHCCYSFENRRKLFEIDSRFKFALVVASRIGPTLRFPCAFYLHDDEWLFGERSDRELHYTLDFVRRTGGEYLSLIELRSIMDLEVAEVCFRNGEPFGKVCDRLGIRLGRELHMTDDAWRFTPTVEILPGGEDPRDPEVAQRLLEMGYLTLHEGKTFWHYNDRWEDPPRYVVALDNAMDRPIYAERARFPRLAYRAIASSTNERTAIFAFLPAGVTCGHSVGIEQAPGKRRTKEPFLVIPITNSFPFDWCLRQMVGANVTQYILFSTPMAQISKLSHYLARSALRLTCNHAGYAPLWHEQFGDMWREPRPLFTWPILAGDDERWAVRAAIDAVVADAYGLSREQYAHVLSTFSHRSYPRAPELCLARYDELKAIGVESFTRKYDPYWDIPLNENLPEPVIDLPIAEVASEGNRGTAAQQEQLLWLAAEPAASQYQPRTRRYPAPDSAASHRISMAATDDETYELLKLLLKEQGVITSHDAQDFTGLDAADLRHMLERLVDEGIAVQEGQGRGAGYRHVER